MKHTIILLVALAASIESFANAKTPKDESSDSTRVVVVTSEDDGGWPQPLIRVENGPVYADEKNLTLRFEVTALKELVKRLERIKPRTNHDNFYRETRGYREAKVTFRVTYVDRSSFEETFEIDSNDPDELEIEFTKKVAGFSSEITGLRDVYKCFDENTCVLEKTISENENGDVDVTAFGIGKENS